MASQGVADVVTAIVAELAEKGGHGLAAGHEQIMMATTIASTEVSIPTKTHCWIASTSVHWTHFISIVQNYL